MVDFSPLFEQTAGQFGLPPHLLARTAQIESAGNPNVRHGGFVGLFQEGSPFVAAHGGLNPLDPASATLMAARGFAEDRSGLRKALGREPTEGELYLAHQQGLGGAEKLLANPNALASALVGAQAVTANGGAPGETARDFAAHWMGKFENQGQGPTVERAMAQFGTVGLPSVAPGQVNAPPNGGQTSAPAPQSNPWGNLVSSLVPAVGRRPAAPTASLPDQPPPADPRALAAAITAGLPQNLVLT